jgi:histidinol-phosphate phosphatase family protein
MKAIFLDRDGVINRKAPEGRYITSWLEVVFLPGVFDAVAALHRAGFLIMIATNQRGVATGKIRRLDLDQIHDRMRLEFSKNGINIADIYCCTHGLEARCVCRKPKPGMLVQAKREYNLELADSWIVGDSQSDIEAGIAAGCKTARICCQDHAGEAAIRADIEVIDLRAAAERILEGKS